MCPTAVVYVLVHLRAGLLVRRRLAGGGIDAADETICAKTGIFGLEGGDPGNGGALERLGLIIAGGGGVVDFALRAEGGKRELPQRQRVGRSGRSGRRGAVLLSDDGHEGGDGREI